VTVNIYIAEVDIQAAYIKIGYGGAQLQGERLGCA